MTQKPLISVVIPVKNGEKTLPKALDAIFLQTLSSKIEVIIIDSGSTDNTFEILKKYPVKLHKIKPEEFSHSQTRNLGVSLAQGEFIVMTVQDAYAMENNCLENAMKHFEDEKVMAVSLHQIVPHDKDKNPLAWYRPQSKPSAKKISVSKTVFEKLSAEEKYELSVIDDVCTIYRKKALKELPFPPTEFGEDRLWGLEALKKGWTIVADYRLLVAHYHYYNFKTYSQRCKNVIRLKKKFGIKKIPFRPLKKIAVFFYHCFISGLVKERKFYWFFYNVNLWLACNFEVLKSRFQKNY